MRAVTVIIISLLFLLLADPKLTLAQKQGFCTGRYVEKSSNWVDGLVQEGDVFEYFCEFPETVKQQQTIEIELVFPNARLLQQVFMPREIYDTVVVMFP